MVIESVKKTNRILIVHEDNLSAGFGAEIAAILAKRLLYLDAPIERLTMPDIANPHEPGLMNAAVPTAEKFFKPSKIWIKPDVKCKHYAQ